MKLLIFIGIGMLLVAVADIMVARGSQFEDMTVVGKSATVVMCLILAFVVGKTFIVMIIQQFKK